MHRLLCLAALAVPFLAPAAASAAGAVPDRVVVGFEPGVGPAERAEIRAAAGAPLVRTLGVAAEQVLRVDGDPAVAAAALEGRDGVAYAEPDHVVRAQRTVDDPFAPQQWALAAVSSAAAWEVARGAGVLVGIVDTGVDFAHPDLARFHVNAAEVAGNGVDDDANGRVDDVRGFDFVGNDGDPSDDADHGTNVTGVIAATANNAVGVAGLASDASVLHAKALGADGSGSSSAVAAGMRYLARQGARIVNLSLGGDSRSTAIASAIAAHPTTLFVVAAGNEGLDNDTGHGSWPCNEPAANVVCVAASTRTGALASFSNWGAASVDLVAPGESLHTTARGDRYVRASGTSFAAPMVAAAAALVLSRAPGLPVAELRASLLGSAVPVEAFAGRTVTGGRLDAAAALGADPAVAPAPPAEPVPAADAPPAPAPAPAPVLPAAGELPAEEPEAAEEEEFAPPVRRPSRTTTPARRPAKSARCLTKVSRRSTASRSRRPRTVPCTPAQAKAQARARARKAAAAERARAKKSRARSAR